MRLGVSNLMWPPAADTEVAAVLTQAGVDRIDLAPSRYFPASLAFDARRAEAVRRFWSDRGVRILQATDAGELLPRVATTPDFFECRFCPWSERCWGLSA